ncbi:MAG: hypothetical protein LBN93_10860 [Candidatus Symbiothrix sp.]|jgi:hypothetical protein|nr:hypothetical protein [Candidatus Symbiothrix sp.]
MNLELKEAIDNYCFNLPYLGFSPQEHSKLGKIAYLSYINEEEINNDEHKSYIIGKLKANNFCANLEKARYDGFWVEFIQRIEKYYSAIKIVDGIELLKN